MKLQKERINIYPRLPENLCFVAPRAHPFGGLYFEGRPSSLPAALFFQTGTARQDLETHNWCGLAEEDEEEEEAGGNALDVPKQRE